MKYEYGEFSDEQISKTKVKLRKQIFFLLLVVDPKTAANYPEVDPKAAIENMLQTLGGLNRLLGYPEQIVTISSTLMAALIEYEKEDFNFDNYRKLILDAGSNVLKIAEEKDAVV